MTKLKEIKKKLLKKYVTIRTVTTEECDWLDNDINKGTVVYNYIGSTFGCVDEFPATFNSDGSEPFFELPYNSIKEI